MLRLSRPMRLPRWTIAIAFAIWLAEFIFSVWLFVLNHRMSRELVQHRWREPTVIIGAHSEVARLYGVDWRTTPPLSMASLPRYVADAFIAAEDVRFRH